LPDRIVFFHPGERFPPISVTGSRCWLRCEHCQGRYLEGMKGVEEPGDLTHLALELERKGANGFLLSGGCLPNGTVPLGRYLGALREIKERTSLELNIHTGLLDRDAARGLVGTGADRFSVDVVQDERVLSRVLNLDGRAKEYGRTLSNLEREGAEGVVPHICVGLPHASIEGERMALDLVSDHEISALVVIGFIPTQGTPMSGYPPPSPSRILRFIGEARDRLNCPILLGCMRPRMDRDLEMDAIEAGVNGVAVPSGSTVEWAKRQGIEIHSRELCCALYR